MTPGARLRGRARLAVVFLALATISSAEVACAADPDAIWKIVHDQCAPGEAQKREPSPCLAVDLNAGFAVLKDRRGATQVLVIPTRRLTGIESPELLAPDAPNYWDDAWRSREFVEKLAGRTIPRDDLALAVNSIDGRSQNQLHIHVDCVRRDVRDALRQALPDIGPRWRPFGIALAGHHYEVLLLTGADLGGRNPFRILADGEPLARSDMGPETLVVVGAVLGGGAPGFFLLSDRANPALGDAGSGEELMDHACGVLTAP